MAGEIITLGLGGAAPIAPRRRQTQLATRTFTAGRVDRFTLDWPTGMQSRDQKVWQDSRQLRQRSRHLADNDPIAAKYLQLCVANIIGPKGVKFQPKVQKLRGGTLADTLNQQLTDEWKLWSERGSCTMDGKMNFAEVERLFARTAAMDGEFLCLMNVADNDWGFALQILDVDQLDSTYFVAPDKSPTGNEIRMGVEVDKFRQPIAYWLFAKHPAEIGFNPFQRKRILAGSVIHAFLADSALQTRGVPWLTPAMYQMNMLKGYMEAEITAARVAACQSYAVTSELGDDTDGDDDGRNADGSELAEMSPGGGMRFGAGEKVEMLKPEHPATAFPSFVQECKRGIATGLGVSYSSLSSDYSQVNFSSERASILVERDMWRVRQAWAIDQFHRRVQANWLAAAVLAGRVSLSVRDESSVLSQCKWHPRGWDWVDPLKDIQAAAESVQNGFTTRARELAKQGLDLEDVLTELAEEQKLIKSLGLELGTDVKGDATAPEDAEEGVTAGPAADQEKPAASAAPAGKSKPAKK